MLWFWFGLGLLFLFFVIQRARKLVHSHLDGSVVPGVRVLGPAHQQGCVDIPLSHRETTPYSPWYGHLARMPPFGSDKLRQSSQTL